MPPVIPQRPKPAGPRRGMVLLPLLTAGIVVVALFKIAEFAVTSGYVTPHAATPTPTGNPFADLATIHPKAAQSAVANLIPQRATVPAFAHNIRFGDAGAPLTLTVFTDPACAGCREQVRTMVAEARTRPVRIVVKSWPQNPANTSGLMFLELARRQNKADAFLALLDAERTDTAETRLITLLEKAGIPLENQRPLFAEQSESILRAIGDDITQGQESSLGPAPQFVLNDYVIDGQVLSPSRLGLYMDRLLKNESPVQAADYWLNPSR